MKKTLIITTIALFAVCFLVAAREGISRDMCASEDIQVCIDRAAACALGENVNIPAYEVDLAVCHDTLCACLESIGCDERMEEANCW